MRHIDKYPSEDVLSVFANVFAFDAFDHDILTKVFLSSCPPPAVVVRTTDNRTSCMR